MDILPIGSVFVTQFHVTRGSEVACRFPPHAIVDGLEGKTLPAGGHALPDDLIIFESPIRSLGVASFRNVRLGSGARASQRGAHFFSVGVVTAHPSDEEQPSGYWEQQERESCVRYTTPLTQLAEEIAAVIASCPELDLTLIQPLLAEDGHVGSDSSSESEDDAEAVEEVLQRKAAGSQIAKLLRDFYAQMSQPQVAESLPTDNSLLFLPAVHYGFGPLLPKLLKLLLPDYLAVAKGVGNAGTEAGKRVLVYCPPGNPLYTASMFALNLLTMLDWMARRGRSALAALEDDSQAQSTQPVFAPRYRGYLSLHDLFSLEEENRVRSLPKDDPRFAPASRAGWVAVTTDRVMVERPRFFDVLVDLSNLMASGTSGAVRAGGAAALAQAGAQAYTEENQMALPTVSVAQTDSSGSRVLARINWTNADFGNWNTAEEHAAELREVVLETAKATRQRQPVSDPHSQTAEPYPSTDEARAPAQAEEEPRMPGQLPVARTGRARPARRSRVMSTLVAFLRYYLAGWGWLSMALLGPLSILPLGNRDEAGAGYTLQLEDDDTLGRQDEEGGGLEPAESSRSSGTRPSGAQLPTASPSPGVAGAGAAPGRGEEPSVVDQSLLTLAQAWSDWGADLVAGVGRTLDAASAAASLEAEATPLTADGAQTQVHVHARTLRQHGLDTRDAVDRALAEAVADAGAATGRVLSIHGQWLVFF